LLRQRREYWRRSLEEVREWVKELAERLAARGVRVSEVFLFGSWARGDYLVYSDLDLVVVSEDWEGMPYVERLSILYRLWDKRVDADFIALTPRELAERVERSIVLWDASRYWVRVYP